MTSPVQHLFFRSELEPRFVGFAFNTVQTAFGRFETGHPSKSELIAVYRLKDTGGNLLGLVNAQFCFATAAFPVSCNNRMQIVFSQPVFAVKGTKGCCPLLAFRHDTGLFPCSILPHLLQLSHCCAQGGIVQLTGELKLAHNGTHLSIVHSNRQFNNKTLRGHRH